MRLCGFWKLESVLFVYGGGGVSVGGEAFKGKVSLREGGEMVNEFIMTAMNIDSCIGETWLWRKNE